MPSNIEQTWAVNLDPILVVEDSVVVSIKKKKRKRNRNSRDTSRPSAPAWCCVLVSVEDPVVVYM
jgi:hypothetical protein